jgi:hypothetical protein
MKTNTIFYCLRYIWLSVYCFQNRLKFLLVASTIVGFDLILGVLQGIKWSFNANCIYCRRLWRTPVLPCNMWNSCIYICLVVFLSWGSGDWSFIKLFCVADYIWSAAVYKKSTLRLVFTWLDGVTKYAFRSFRIISKFVPTCRSLSLLPASRYSW